MSGAERAVLVAAAVLMGVPSLAGAAEWRITIRNETPVPAGTPVVAELSLNVPPGSYDLRGTEGQLASGHAQVFLDAGKTYLARIVTELANPGTRRFTLEPLRPTPPPGVEIVPSGKDLQVSVAGRLLTIYRAGEMAKPYYYPLIGPTDVPFTRAYPMIRNVASEDHDHPHQRSFWFTHGNVNGIDFWASDPLNGNKASYGSIRETSRQMVTGPVVGVVRTTDEWLDHAGNKVLDDERVVRFYNTRDTRVIDFDIKLLATSGPVTFNDTKEGMFGLRVASSMDVTKKQGGKITNAEGLHDEPAWGKPSAWVDYTGPVGGKTVGIAVLNHPESFRYPTTWHVRTYGLFAANPFGWHDFGQKKSGAYTIPAGESITFRYRVILHAGGTTAAGIAAAFQAYAQPPRVEIKSE